MLRVRGFKDFQDRYKQVRGLRELYVFILFDEPTKKTIEKFVHNSFDWLDRLAAASKVFGFAFDHRGPDFDEAANPSLEVAALFEIRPRELPGVVVFSMLPENDNVNDAVFLPLKEDLVREEREGIEQFFRDLFSLLQEAQGEAKAQGGALARFRDLTRQAENRRRWQGVQRYLRSQLQEVANMPSKLLESIGTAFGDAAAKQAFGG